MVGTDRHQPSSGNSKQMDVQGALELERLSLATLTYRCSEPHHPPVILGGEPWQAATTIRTCNSIR